MTQIIKVKGGSEPESVESVPWVHPYNSSMPRIALEFSTKDYTEEIENLIWSAFSEFQFFIIHLVSLIFGFTRLAVMCLV